VSGLQQRLNFKTPFHRWITSRLILKRLACDQVDQPQANLRKNALNGLGFSPLLSDTHLSAAINRDALADR